MAATKTTRSPRTQQQSAEDSARGTLSTCERARLAATAMHALHDAHTITAKARQASMRRFEQQVDPSGTLPDIVRAIRAEAARKLHYTSIALIRWRMQTAATVTTSTASDTATTVTPQRRYRLRHVCRWCCEEQGVPAPVGVGGRICHQHRLEWRIDALRYITHHGGLALLQSSASAA